MIYLYESTAVMMYLYEQMRVKPLRKPAQAVTGVGRRDGELEQGQGRARSPDQRAQALSMSRARAPTPTLRCERTCTMPRRHDRVALSTVWTLVSTLCEVNVAMDLVLRAPV